MKLHYPLILDGATGTELAKRGYSYSQCAEQWVLEHPEVMLDLQKSYIAAGSQAVYSGTFGGNRVRLGQHGLGGKVREYNLRLAELSRQAAGDQALVVGDIAPTGEFGLEFDELLEIYTEQAAALEEAGVDLFAVETMMLMDEAKAAVQAVQGVSKKPVFVTFTCNEAGFSLAGVTMLDALQAMQDMGVDAFGLNCSVGPETMLSQLQQLSSHARLPLIFKPNAGLPELKGKDVVYTSTPESFAACVDDLAKAGVAVFGGCCGTEPAHIKALSEAVRQVKAWTFPGA